MAPWVSLETRSYKILERLGAFCFVWVSVSLDVQPHSGRGLEWLECERVVFKAAVVSSISVRSELANADNGVLPM